MPANQELKNAVHGAASVVGQLTVVREARNRGLEVEYVDGMARMNRAQVARFVELIERFGKGPLVDERTDQQLAQHQIYAMAITVKDWWDEASTLPVILVGPQDVIVRLSEREHVTSHKHWGRDSAPVRSIHLDVRGVASENIVRYEMPADYFGRGIGRYVSHVREGHGGGSDGAEMLFLDLRRGEESEPALCPSVYAGRPAFSMVFVECGFPGEGIGGVNVYTPS